MTMREPPGMRWSTLVWAAECDGKVVPPSPRSPQTIPANSATVLLLVVSRSPTFASQAVTTAAAGSSIARLMKSAFASLSTKVVQLSPLRLSGGEKRYAVCEPCDALWRPRSASS